MSNYDFKLIPLELEDSHFKLGVENKKLDRAGLKKVIANGNIDYVRDMVLLDEFKLMADDIIIENVVNRAFTLTNDYILHTNRVADMTETEFNRIVKDYLMNIIDMEMRTLYRKERVI